VLGFGPQAGEAILRRRNFITLLEGAATAWPLAAGAQQPDGVRRIGVFQTIVEDDPMSAPLVAAFQQQLQELAWVVGRNIQIAIRFGAGTVGLYHTYAAELVGGSTECDRGLQHAHLAGTTAADPHDFERFGDAARVIERLGKNAGRFLRATSQPAVARFDLTIHTVLNAIKLIQISSRVALSLPTPRAKSPCYAGRIGI